MNVDMGEYIGTIQKRAAAAQQALTAALGQLTILQEMVAGLQPAGQAVEPAAPAPANGDAARSLTPAAAGP